MSSKKDYKKMPEKQLLSIKRLALTELKKIRESIIFDKRYGNENLFDSKHLKVDEIMNTIRHIDEAMEVKNEKR